MNIQRMKAPPMAVGLFLAGLLLFAVVGIARNVGGATVANAMQNNVAAAIAVPVQPQQPQVQQVTQIVKVVQWVVTATPTRPPHWWLDVTVDVTGGWWVWADAAWISCSHIDDTLNYGVESGHVSARTWQNLHQSQRQQIYQRCQEVMR
jgi:hypothetical protein